MASSILRRVMVVGAGGQIGRHIVAALLADGQFSVTALTRPDSASDMPAGLHEVKSAAYEDHEALVAAMRGQDILVITMGVMAPQDSQMRLIDAAAAAGISYIVPSEWSCDHAQVQLGRDIMTGDAQAAVRAHVEATGVSKWISIGCGFWYEFSLAGGPTRFGFDFEKKQLTLFDEGETKISVTTWPRTAQALTRVLAAPDLEKWANTQVLVSSFGISQREMLASVLRVTGGNEGDWTIVKEDAHARFARGMGLLQQGEFVEGFTLAMYSRAFFKEDPMFHEGKTVNLELGMEQEDLDVATAVARHMALGGSK